MIREIVEGNGIPKSETAKQSSPTLLNGSKVFRGH